MKKNILTLAVILATTHCLAAFNIQNPTAKITGMGNSFVAIADDVNAIYSNPAGLINMKNWEALFSYGKLHMGIGNLGESFIAAGVPLNQYGTVGVGWYNFSETTYKEDIFFLAYSYPIKNGGIGIDIKYLSKAYVSNDWTTLNPYFTSLSKANFSLGISFFTHITKDMSFGFLIDDFNEPNIAINGEEKLPMTIRTGVKYNFIKASSSALEFQYRNYDWKLHLGNDMLILRTGEFGVLKARVGGGIGSNGYANAAAGIGYKFNIPYANLGCEFDYGFLLPFGFASGSSGTHKVSLKFTDFFKELKKEAEEEKANIISQ